MYLAEIDTYDDFSEICALNDAQIDPAIEAAVRDKSWIKTVSNHNEDILAAIAITAYRARQLPAEKLVSGPLTIPDRYHGAVGIMTLGSMLNSSIEPLPERTGTPYFPYTNHQTHHYCKEADPEFGLIISEILSTPGTTTYGRQLIAQDNEPILMRKGDGAPTAISLTTVNIAGVPYPPGALLRVDLAQDELRRKTTVHEVARQGQEVLDIGEVESVTFLRLSAFALEGDRRRRMLNWYRNCSPLLEATISTADLHQVSLSLQAVGSVAA